MTVFNDRSSKMCCAATSFKSTLLACLNIAIPFQTVCASESAELVRRRSCPSPAVLGVCATLMCALIGGCDNYKPAKAPAPEPVVAAAPSGARSDAFDDGAAVLKPYGLTRSLLRPPAGRVDVNNDGTRDRISFAVVADAKTLAASGLRVVPVSADGENPDAQSILKNGDSVMLVYGRGSADLPLILPIWQARAAEFLTPTEPPQSEIILCWPVEAQSALLLSAEEGASIVYGLNGTYKSESCSQ